jgi:threonine dehydratase
MIDDRHQRGRGGGARVAGRIRRTPVLRPGRPVWFKLEFLQHAGSFKTRGMLNQILAAAERGLPAAGIIAASGGNAGLAAAYAARELGVPAEVYVPVTAPPVKVAKLAKLGARVVQVGTEYAEAYAAAVVQADVTGALFCHAYDDPDMVAGNGTLGLELLEQIPDGFDTVLVAVGGGGLIAGVAAALRDRARVVAVEPVTSAALHAAMRGGRPGRRRGLRGGGRLAGRAAGRDDRVRDLRSRPKLPSCWSTTRRSWTPGGSCGRTTGSWSSTAPPPPRRR